ncbi:hypothetical protein WOC76_24015 [Methylocystis sp. IM3]|jgi:hypothetical protein|uniref:hypothetical protein n=1 Tax=unclassified Methylocystis TaxID=2625913 RepID=UPI000F9E6922|nr:MAG: hypothetical protein EKK29_11130 [Hyphomicrobiales bacterium]
MPKSGQFVPLFDEGNESAEIVAPPQARVFGKTPAKIIANRDDASEAPCQARYFFSLPQWPRRCNDDDCFAKLQEMPEQWTTLP